MGRGRCTKPTALVWAAAALLASFLPLTSSTAQSRINIPKIWDDAELSAMTLPPALPEGKIIYLPSETYYKLKPLPVHKTYPVYHPDREPKGYFEWPQRQEPQRQKPQTAFNPTKPPSKSDWKRAGEIVFHAPTDFASAASIHDRAWFSTV